MSSPVTSKPSKQGYRADKDVDDSGEVCQPRFRLRVNADSSGSGYGPWQNVLAPSITMKYLILAGRWNCLSVYYTDTSFEVGATVFDRSS